MTELERVLVCTVEVVNTITNSPESSRREAAAWLAGELRWERLLDQLRQARTGAAEGPGADIDVPDDHPARRSEAA